MLVPAANHSVPRDARPPSCKAFTLIELLVTCFVIATLASLLLPAVLSARGSARRAQCAANLHQIGLAMANYHALHDMFPPSHLKTGRNSTSNNMSEFAFLLPYLDQQPVFSSINMDFCRVESVETPTVENRTARTTRIATYLCPGDGEPNHRNSYRFNRGRLGGKVASRGFDGPFNIRVLPSQATVTDGLSRTAFVSERVAGSFIAGAAHPKRDIKYPEASGATFYSDAQFIPFCLSAPAAQWRHTAGRYWLISSFSDTHYNHNGTPNDPRPTCSLDLAQDNGFGLHPPRSYHPGVVNVLFGDGHLEAVADSIYQDTWIALGTHDSGD